MQRLSHATGRGLSEETPLFPSFSVSGPLPVARSAQLRLCPNRLKLIRLGWAGGPKSPDRPHPRASGVHPQVGQCNVENQLGSQLSRTHIALIQLDISYHQ